MFPLPHSVTDSTDRTGAAGYMPLRPIRCHVPTYVHVATCDPQHVHVFYATCYMFSHVRPMECPSRPPLSAHCPYLGKHACQLSTHLCSRRTLSGFSGRRSYGVRTSVVSGLRGVVASVRYIRLRELRTTTTRTLSSQAYISCIWSAHTISTPMKQPCKHLYYSIADKW